MLEKELNFIKAHLNSLEKENLDVSKANVGWHLDHSVKVINSVFKGLQNSNSNEYKKEFNLLRSFIFTLGTFPRGKVKSPKRVLPPEIILKEDVENQLRLVTKNLESFNDLEKNSFFIHPLF
ncbi:MAG: DUF1569 domain-containing protein, partial [Polaribacter sp.]